LIASSTDRGWRGVAAEVRNHPQGALPAISSDTIEITLAVEGNAEAYLHRCGAGVRQKTRVDPGALWLCPAGVNEDEVRMTGDLPGIFHIYLPRTRLSGLADEYGLSGSGLDEIQYLAGVDDGVIRQLGLSLLSELQAETFGGSMLAETAATALCARLIGSYRHNGGQAVNAPRWPQGDRGRLKRVIDYIEASLDQTISNSDLAALAGMSEFHFIRMFQKTTGQSPYKYLSARRLQRARVLIATGQAPVDQIATACGFTSVAGFNRAFRRATGHTPRTFRALSN
jgi:AraC family transcriptional regulator